MAFNDKEISTQDGRVAALYLLEWGKTQWRYTSADRPIERMEMVAGVNTLVTYEPRALKDNGMVQGSSSQNDFQVDGPGDLPIVRLFRGSPPSETIWLTVRRQHVGEPDAPIYWIGTVWNVKRPSEAKCLILGRPISASLKRTGLRLCWTKECPHFIYDNGCKVDPEDHRTNGVVTAISGNSLVVTLEGDEHEPGYFVGGILAWEASDEGTIERRMIETAVTDDADTTFTIFGLVDFLEIGDSMAAYPGCQRVPDVCDGRFDNLDNYGGFDKMPGASPFNSAIW